MRSDRARAIRARTERGLLLRASRQRARAASHSAVIVGLSRRQLQYARAAHGSGPNPRGRALTGSGARLSEPTRRSVRPKSTLPPPIDDAVPVAGLYLPFFVTPDEFQWSCRMWQILS